MERRRTVCLAAAIAISLLLAGAAFVHRLAPGHAYADGPVALVVEPLVFDPGNPGRTRFGALVWRGGLVLSAPAPFGGLSGLALSADGTRLVAVSDRGFWLRARLRYDNARLAGADEAVLTPLAGADGAALKAKTDADAEGLAALGEDGESGYLVAFERRHRIGRYGAVGTGFAPRGHLPLGALVDTLPDNGGIEALGLLPGMRGEADVIVAISETAHDGKGDHRGWLIATDGAPQAFSVRRVGAFDITDLAILPGGDMVLLERRYVPLLGGAFRLRRIAGRDIRPGARLDGPVLLEAGTRLEVDNMEGLAAHRGTGGETVLTLVSDDNYSPVQRTLLLQFALPPGE